MNADPDTQQRVTLDVVGKGRIPARVEQSEEGHITLALYVIGDEEDGDVVSDEHGAILEFTSRRGLHRLEGFVRGTEEPDLLDFERRREPEVLQRRDYARASAAVPVRVWIGDDERKLHTLNVSGNGMLVHCDEQLEVGTEFWFEVELEPGAPPLSGRATTVRVQGEMDYGVTIDLSEKGRDRLVHYVFERLRRERLVSGS